MQGKRIYIAPFRQTAIQSASQEHTDRLKEKKMHQKDNTNKELQIFKKESR